MIAYLLGIGLPIFILVWYLYRKKSKEVVADKPTSPSPVQLSAESQLVPVSDPFLDEIVEGRVRMIEQVKAATQEHQRVTYGQFSHDLEVLQRLSYFAREQELDKAMLALWKEIDCYPEWSKRETFSNWNRLNLEEIEDCQEGGHRTISFSQKGHLYRLSRLVKSCSFTGKNDVEFILQENGEEVFAITCSAEYDADVPQYKCTAVSAFKRRGHWAQFLLEMYRILQICRSKSSIESISKSVIQSRKRFED